MSGPPPSHGRAVVLLGAGEIADAIAAFLQALEEDPDHADSYLGLAQAYEAAYEVLPDPDLLLLVGEVLRGLRDRPLSSAQRRTARELEARATRRLEGPPDDGP